MAPNAPPWIPIHGIFMRSQRQATAGFMKTYNPACAVEKPLGQIAPDGGSIDQQTTYI
jgi:hypothetical protein